MDENSYPKKWLRICRTFRSIQDSSITLDVLKFGDVTGAGKKEFWIQKTIVQELDDLTKLTDSTPWIICALNSDTVS